MRAKEFKPWVKVSSSGKIWVDTSDPRWQEWFDGQIRKLREYHIVNGRLVHKETGRVVADQG